ncbi:MAG: bifunctional nuclease family protein [Bacteroidales bacterium]|nr:bifunctional nuclease family protein [Bacteroidales bacterium]
MMNKIKLNVLGLSYSQTQSGAYALVLAEENGKRRIPIIIGGFEAQSIAIELEGLKPPRPLTHDLFVNFATAFNINLIEVNINKLEEGIFFADLVCDNGSIRIKIDARTSDAVALAIRFKCPIYTTEEIMTKAGIVLNIEKTIKRKEGDKTKEKNQSESILKQEHQNIYSNKTIKELQTLLKEAIEKEDYEKASKLRDEINRRK